MSIPPDIFKRLPPACQACLISNSPAEAIDCLEIGDVNEDIVDYVPCANSVRRYRPPKPEPRSTDIDRIFDGIHLGTYVG